MARPQLARCKRGHPMSGPNLRVTAAGQRVCRECHRIRARLNRAGFSAWAEEFSGPLALPYALPALPPRPRRALLTRLPSRWPELAPSP